MSIKKRFVELANFNCVFGDNNQPLLGHFSDVFYPAITSNISIKYNHNNYSFDNIKLINHPTLGYVLTGIFIKQTQLEVLSEKDPISGKLISTNKHIPSAPFSIFVILLKNHRMLFLKNQNGSPRTSTFGTICEKIISRYLKEANANANYNSKLPAAHISIIPLPSHMSLKEHIHNLQKIDSLIYHITPLNGDDKFRSEMADLLNQLHELNAKKGIWEITSPNNKEKVIHHIIEVRDLAPATIKGTTNNGSSITLTPDDFSEKVPISLPLELNHDNAANSMYDIAQNNTAILETSENNKSLYEEAKDMLKSLVR